MGVEWHRFPIVYRDHLAIREWLLEHVGPMGAYHGRTGSWAWDVDRSMDTYYVCIPDARMATLYKLTWA